VGPPLSEILRRPNQDLMGRLRRAGEALNLLHGLPESLARGFELRDFAQEMEEIAQASGFVKTLLAEEGALIEALLESAREANGRLEQAPPTFIHGDLKLEHLLVTETGMALIDFDTCGRGDPALDAGTFLADLRLWYAVYHQPGLEKAQGKFLEGYAPGAPAAWLVRARLYEAIELVKMAARRLPLFDEHWPALMESLVRDARRVMEGVEADLGLVAQNPGSTGAVHFSPPILDPRAASHRRPRFL
jgi:aminoglycoside phosphotransferase (APT) family kinase protein